MAELKAGAAKPLNPIVWILFGGALVLVAVAMLLDSRSSIETQTRGAEGVQAVLGLIYRVLGKPAATALFGFTGTLALTAGVVGWVKSRRG